jgi:hypothetical protein
MILSWYGPKPPDLLVKGGGLIRELKFPVRKSFG